MPNYPPLKNFCEINSEKLQTCRMHKINHFEILESCICIPKRIPAKEPNRNRKPEPSEPRFQEPEPGTVGTPLNWTERPFPRGPVGTGRPEPLEPFRMGTVTEPNQGHHVQQVQLHKEHTCPKAENGNCISSIFPLLRGRMVISTNVFGDVVTLAQNRKTLVKVSQISCRLPHISGQTPQTKGLLL